MEELQHKTGTSETECKALLSEIGAEGITLRDGREGWRLLVFGFVMFATGWIGSQADIAIAQNEVAMIGRPPVSGDALGIWMPNGEASVFHFGHEEGRSLEDSSFELLDCGNASVPCYVHWICGESLAYDERMLDTPVYTEVRCPGPSSLLITELPPAYLLD